MKKLPLDRLFLKKLMLHKEKYKHIYNIFYASKSYFGIYHSVIYLKDIIRQEIQLNQRIVRKVRRIYKRKTKEKPYFIVLENTTNELIKTLKKEYSIIKDIGMLSVIKYDFKVLFKKSLKHSYLKDSCLRFKTAFEDEQDINKELVEELYKKNLELYGLTKEKRKSFQESKALLSEAQKLLKVFVKSIGNKDNVTQVGKDLLGVLDSFQNTDIYEFVQQDVKAIKKKVKYVMANPKKHKLTYLFTGIYLVAPTTFEITGIILTLRYMTKYTIKKTKAIKPLSKDNSIRRQIKKRIKKLQ